MEFRQDASASDRASTNRRSRALAVAGRQRTKQGGWRNIERYRQTANHIKARRSLPPLNARHVGPMQVGSLSQRLLRQAEASPQFSNSLPECEPKVFHGENRGEFDGERT